MGWCVQKFSWCVQDFRGHVRDFRGCVQHLGAPSGPSSSGPSSIGPPSARQTKIHSFFVWVLGRSCETLAASACIEISLNMGVHKQGKSGCKIGAKYNTEFGRVTWNTPHVFCAFSHTFNFFVPRSSLRSAHDRIFNVQALPALLLHFVGHSPVLAAIVCQYFPRNPAGMLVWHRLQRHLAHIRLRKEFASQFFHPPTLSVPSLFQGSTNPFNALENHRCPFSIATTTQTTKN